MLPLLLTAATLAAPNPARHEKPSAVGLNVLVHPSASTSTNRTDPTLTPASTLTGTEFAVLREEPGRVMVRNKGTDVWVSRSEVMTPKEAIAYYTELLNAQPQTTNFVRRAKAHELNFDWDGAIKDYDEAIQLSPQTSAFWNNRANYYSRKREYQKALDGYDEAVKLSPTSFIPLGNRGNLFNNLREWDKALEAYERSIKVNPSYARAYSGRSTAWREKGDLEKAMKEAERGVELDPTSPHTLYGRGLNWMAMKEYDKALADFEEVLRFDPLFAAGYYGRAGTYLVRKQYQKAIRDLDTAMRLTPNYAAAMARRAEAWIACGNPKKALSDLNDAIAADDRYPAAYRQKAWLLATHPDDGIRDGKLATEAARKAVELMKSPKGEFLETLAAALAETGDFAGAIEQQKKALANSEYAKEKGDVVKNRLATYEANKPLREPNP
jgi:tetratricopeptide (TPR) repeat protein